VQSITVYMIYCTLASVLAVPSRLWSLMLSLVH